MVYKKIVLLLLTYTIAHCSNHGMLSLPRELFDKIIKIDIEIDEVQKFSDRIHEFQSLQRNDEYSLKDLCEDIDKEKDILVQLISFLEKIISLSRVNKAFHKRITNYYSDFYSDCIKPSIVFLSHYMKGDICYSLTAGKKCIIKGGCDVEEMLKSAEILKYYLRNRSLIKLAERVDVSNFILKHYLPAALLIPDYMAKSIAKKHAGNFLHIYYARMVYQFLQPALQRTSNNIVLSTSEQMNIFPGLIHEYLDISVHFLEEKNGLYYYFVNKRSNTINKESNVGFVIKKDSNQGCVIS